MAKVEMIFQRPVDGALYMYRKGYKVFPLHVNKKEPAFNGWQNWATTATEKKIESFGTANSMNNWGVYCGPSGLTVIDLDLKPAENTDGFKALAELETVQGDKLNKDTLTVMTPTKGEHLYYIGECKTTVGSKGGLAKGVDTRGVGGYVVAPGSRIDEEYYVVTNDSDPTPLTNWIPEKLYAKKESVVLDDVDLVGEGERNQTLARLAGAMRRNGLNYEAIYAALLVVNDQQLESPLPEQEVEIVARSIARYKPEHAKAASDFMNLTAVKALTANLIDLTAIPKRDWIMQNRYIGGFISVVVAPGGVGKSTLTMLDAIAIATNKELTGFGITKPGAVWIYNTEDPMDELKRRIGAIALHNNIPLSCMENVHVTSGREQPLILAKAGHDGVVINQQALDMAIDYINENNIVLLLADPFVRTHEVSENDNMQIDKVVWCFQRIADRTGCAIGLVHHSRKPGANGSNAGDMNTARGASSLVNAARIAHTLQPMSENESTKFGISKDKRSWFIRLDNAKANLQAPAERADWYEKKSIKLMNGDTVGTIERSPVMDKVAQKAEENMHAEKRDVIDYMASVFSVGDRISLKDVHVQISTDPKHAHLFKGTEAEPRWGVPKLITIFKAELCSAGKRFSYLFESRNRTKHWVVCSKAGELEEFLQ